MSKTRIALPVCHLLVRVYANRNWMISIVSTQYILACPKVPLPRRHCQPGILYLEGVSVVQRTIQHSQARLFLIECVEALVVRLRVKGAVHREAKVQAAQASCNECQVPQELPAYSS